MTLSSYQSGFLRLEACRRRKRIESRLGRTERRVKSRPCRGELFRNNTVTSAHSTALTSNATPIAYIRWECQALPSPIKDLMAERFALLNLSGFPSRFLEDLKGAVTIAIT